MTTAIGFFVKRLLILPSSVCNFQFAYPHNFPNCEMIKPFSNILVVTKHANCCGALQVTTMAEMLTTEKPMLTAKILTDQEVRWCPGCGDYSILAGCKVMPAAFLKKTL
jgi:hypothetical protein